MLLVILLSCAAVMAVSLSGKLLTWKGAGSYVERNLHFFVSFAAGVLLVVSFNLSLELIEHAGSLLKGLPWVVLGVALVLIALRFVPQYHHHHDSGEDGHTHSRIDANRILLGDGMHNIGDGVVITVAYGVSAMLGFATTLSIMVHELLQEISEFFVLREAGLPTRQALLYNFISSSSVLLGALGGYFILVRFASFEAPLIGVAVGAYLVIVFHDLIPHSLSKATSTGHITKHLVYFGAGVLLMACVVAFLPHA